MRVDALRGEGGPVEQQMVRALVSFYGAVDGEAPTPNCEDVVCLVQSFHALGVGGGEVMNIAAHKGAGMTSWASGI